MSPSKFQDSDLKGMISGAGPSQLRTSKYSHTIHKPSFSSSHHQPIIENPGHTPAPKHNNVLKRQPVIIYTHSPKVIHAQARDFMALVQKLTGLSSDEDEKPPKSEPKLIKDEGSKNSGLKIVGYKENEASSLTGEKFIMGDQTKKDCSTASQIYNISNSCMTPGDGPLFTPSANDFLCSSSMTNSFLQSPGMANSISPSFMDYVNTN